MFLLMYQLSVYSNIILVTQSDSMTTSRSNKLRNFVRSVKRVLDVITPQMNSQLLAKLFSTTLLSPQAVSIRWMLVISTIKVCQTQIHSRICSNIQIKSTPWNQSSTSANLIDSLSSIPQWPQNSPIEREIQLIFTPLLYHKVSRFLSTLANLIWRMAFDRPWNG